MKDFTLGVSITLNIFLIIIGFSLYNNLTSTISIYEQNYVKRETLYESLNHTSLVSCLEYKKDSKELCILEAQTFIDVIKKQDQPLIPYEMSEDDII